MYIRVIDGKNDFKVPKTARESPFLYTGMFQFKLDC